MIVAHIVSHLNTGGAEKLVAEMSNIMSRKGITIKVITLFKGRGVPFEILETKNIELIELNYDSKYNPMIAMDLYKHTKDCDIVHTHTYYAQLYASLFIAKKKLITTEHSTHNNRRGKSILQFFDYLMYARYSKIICISTATKESLNQWIRKTKRKSLIIHNGVDIDKYFHAIPISRKEIGVGEGEIILTCVGRFEKAKNQEIIIKALKEINIKAKLILVGHGQKEEELKLLVENLNLNKRVIFLKQRSDVERILKSSDIFILPSLWEGFGLAAVEALASGLPALLSNVDGLKEVTTNLECDVEYFNPYDLNEIVLKTNQTIEKLQASKKEKQLEKNNFEKYDLNNMVEKYLVTYSKN
ncbi:glycosyltransferase [Peribacillus sp. YIM B13540]|uniref:glycosyltransferase n=1 Tax=Peribacillus sp. YIM B13540 TaxID=3366296 RepID=UPI00366F15F7